MKSTSLFGLRPQKAPEVVKSTALTWLVPSGERHRASVEIQRAPEGLTACLPEPVEIGRTVWVNVEPVGLRAFVRSCERAETGFVLSLGLLPRERRGQDRVPAAGRGTLHFPKTPRTISTSRSSLFLRTSVRTLEWPYLCLAGVPSI